jgi:phage terminase large subunit GpA-like protein
MTQIETTASIADDIWRLWKPPPKLTLSEWADKYRVLSSESSSEPGRWVTARAPYQKAIMNAIMDPNVPRVVVQKASQLGITEVFNTAIAFLIDSDPCPIFLVEPTVELAEAFVTDRFRPMIRDTPKLRGLVADPKSRDPRTTLRRISFRGGFLSLGGANSAASLSGRSVRFVFLDDCDRFPASAGVEGSPIQLAIARSSAFWNRKIVIASSPGIAGASHIERELEHSDQSHWYLPCPSCNFFQTLDWDRVRFSDYTHRCLQCNEHAPRYRWLAGAGQWRSHQPLDKRGQPIATHGFYLSGLYSPWLDWATLGIEFARANAAAKKTDLQPLKAFLNTRLGQLWHPPARKVETNLYERREVYKYT